MAPVAHSHQLPIKIPPKSELARTQPALWGSERFLKTAPVYLRLRCQADQHAQLDDIERRLTEANHIRWGADDIPQRVAEYQRWKAEHGIIELLSKLPQVVKIDARSGGPTEESSDVLNINRQAPSILLEVRTGDGPVEFFTADWNLQREAHPEDFQLVVADRGTTYVLLRLLGVPAGDNQERFSIRRRGEEKPFRWHGVKWAAAPWGNLSVSFQDEHGKPTPAIVSLKSQSDGTLWEIEDAIDMRPQLNNVVNEDFIDFGPGQGYTFFLPGTQRGRYWIVEPECEIPIPAGKWQVRIQNGMEYVPIVQDVEVTPGDWTKKSYQLKRWVNMPQQGWWSGDDHVHARLMSKADADRLLTYCQAVDLHVANILQMGDVARTYYAQRGFGKEFRVRDGNYWLIPGQEDPRSVLGHAIGLNLQQVVRDVDVYLQNDIIAKRIHDQGGLYGHTHLADKACFVERELALFTPMGIVDFNSVMQSALGTELFYDMLNLGFKMTASAGADTPYGGTIGTVRMFAYTGDKTELDPDKWFDAIKAGRTFVTNGPMLEFEVEGHMPGESIDLEQPTTLQVRASAKGYVGGCAVKELRIVRLGEAVAAQTSDDTNQTDLELNVEVETGDGCWIAAHAIGHDGSQAHSTPVYVSVDGSRHWAVEKAPGLIKKQLDTLDDIEKALAESEATNHGPLDYWNLVNTKQADAVRQRVAKVRKIYQGMLDDLQSDPSSKDQ